MKSVIKVILQTGIKNLSRVRPLRSFSSSVEMSTSAAIAEHLFVNPNY